MTVHAFLSHRRKPRFKLPPGSVRRALPRVRAGGEISLCAEPALHAGGCTEGDAARAARASRHRARGDRAGELPRHRQCGDARLHCVGSQTLSRRRDRRRQLHRQGFRQARRRRRARRALQFREASRRRAGHGGVQPRHRPHQGSGLARRSACRCARHHAALGDDAKTAAAVSSSITWAACLRPPASISRRCAR